LLQAVKALNLVAMPDLSGVIAWCSLPVIARLLAASSVDCSDLLITLVSTIQFVSIRLT